MGRPSQKLNRVLYVRIDRKLERTLKKLAEEERKKQPGLVISMADIVRKILIGATTKRSV